MNQNINFVYKSFKKRPHCLSTGLPWKSHRTTLLLPTQISSRLLKSEFEAKHLFFFYVDEKFISVSVHKFRKRKILSPTGSSINSNNFIERCSTACFRRGQTVGSIPTLIILRAETRSLRLSLDFHSHQQGSFAFPLSTHFPLGMKNCD